MNISVDTLSPNLLSRFADIVGDRYAATDPGDLAGFLEEPRGLYHGRTAMLLRPGSTDELAAIVRLAAETGTPLVPQGGNTGLVGGQSPRSMNEILVSLSRMNRIREIDAVGRTVTVEAGAILKNVQEAADEAGLFFPLSLGSEGSCTIGGNLASNAGGTGVLAYGSARDLCLGVEAVLASGDVFHGLRRLKKDNRGYDLRHLLIGSEGTLGIITAAVLKLFPRPAGREVAMVGLSSPDAALALLTVAERHAGGALTGFELMARRAMEFTIRHTEGAREPLAEAHPWYVLCEISSSRSGEDAMTTLAEILEEGLECGVVNDAAVAQSIADANAFWRLREEMSWAQKPEGGSIKHDVAVPVASIPEFLRRAEAAVERAVPGARPVPFGHLGDGNIHFNVSQPVGADMRDFLERWDEVSRIVHDIAAELDGTFSAEHGIGQLKLKELVATKEGAELDAMRAIKRALDPNGILNPGKLIQV